LPYRPNLNLPNNNCAPYTSPARTSGLVNISSWRINIGDETPVTTDDISAEDLVALENEYSIAAGGPDFELDIGYQKS
jgi:hypothetical protein